MILFFEKIYIKRIYRLESGVSDVTEILAFAFSTVTLPALKFDVLPLIFIFSSKNRSYQAKQKRKFVFLINNYNIQMH